MESGLDARHSSVRHSSLAHTDSAGLTIGSKACYRVGWIRLLTMVQELKVYSTTWMVDILLPCSWLSSSMVAAVLACMRCFVVVD